ncbi:NmrA/HSCARG family protein [Salinimicrobium soli]|uniref:NmrA/HSCARG family protein n=1 Tax=Salinimicrobium soli TaxID=1254399 RepID=UPI003AAB828D
MASEKIIFVTGGTGKQGGAVARHLAREGFKVRALTRHPDSEKAREQESYGVQPVKGNLDDVSTYSEYLEDAHGVYSVQTFEKGVKKEIEQGKTLANLADQYNIRHFVYSSVAGADLRTGIPHFESKLEIEEHIKLLELPYTILRPVSFFENFLIPQVRRGIMKGSLVQPVKKETRLQYISTEDIGRVATQCFLHPEKYLFRTLTLAAEELTGEEAAEVLSKELNLPVNYKMMPWMVRRFLLGKDLYKMFTWIDHGNALAPKEEIIGKDEFPNMVNFRNWVGTHFKTAKA